MGEVFQVCECKLKIENSSDPVIHEFLGGDKMEKSSKESRIEDENRKTMRYVRTSKPQKNLRHVANRKDREKKDSAVKGDVREVEKRKKLIQEIIKVQVEMAQKKSHYCVKNPKGDDQKIVKYKLFWSSTLSGEEKRCFSKVSMKDLERHSKMLKDYPTLDLLSEAVSFAKEHKTWRYWQCCVCAKKFGDCELYRNHMKKMHMPDLDGLKLQNEISSKWIEMIENGEWKPVDPVVAVEIVNQMQSDFYSTCNCALCNEKAFHKNKSFLVEDVSSTDGEEESREEFFASEGDENVSFETFMDDKKWPFCDDSRRANILERIHEILLLLLKSKCIGLAHLQWAMIYTIDQLGIIIPASYFMGHSLENHKVICLLGASELQKLLETLNQLAQICCFSENPEIDRTMDDKLSGDQECGIRERVAFNRDFSCLLLDEGLLRGELNLTNYFEAVANDGSAVVNVSEDDVLPDTDDILSWLYVGPDLKSWTSLRGFQRGKAKKVFQIIVEEGLHLGKMGDQIVEILTKIKAVGGIYVEEIAREKNPVHVPQLYVNLLRKRQKELQRNDDKASRIESDAITNVLNEALAVEALLGLRHDQSAFEECVAELELRTLEGVEDNSIRLASQHMNLELIKDMAFVNAIVFWSAGAIKRYEMILEKMSAYDYRSIIVPLLKSFLKTYLEDMFDKEAAKKSKHEKKTKNKKMKKKKKKKKHFSKAMESQETDGRQDVQLHQKDAEQAEEPNTEIGACESTDKLKEVSAIDQRLLQEHLEYQKNFENEAKQKRLAEKRFQADVERAVCLTLESFEKHHEPLPIDVKDGRTPRFDIHQYVIIQSQWRLRQLRDDFMSRSDIRHVHAGNPCFLCAYHDSFSAIRIASRNMPEEASGANTSAALPVQHFFEEPLNTEDLVDKDAPEICIYASAYELKKQLVSVVRKIVEELEHERQMKNKAKQDGLAEQILAEDTFLKGEEFRPLLTNPSMLGPGLIKEAADCFLTVVIKTLWHLREFREKFMSRPLSEHNHVGHPCVVCVLYELFSAIQDNQGKAIASNCFRNALSTCYHNGNKFQEGQTNDASELLQVILWSLHESSTLSVPDSVHAECKFKGSLDCFTTGCFVHTIFGMDHYKRINCSICNLESRHHKYTSLFLTINVSNLIMMKSKHGHRSFDMLFKLAEMTQQLTCDPSEGGCEQMNHIHHTLWCLPHVFTIVLHWQTAMERCNDISATLSALSPELNLSVLFQGYQPENIYFLVSMVCYSGPLQHHICFIYSNELGKYVLHHDRNAKVIGSWNDVVSTCHTMCLRPLILFFIHKSSKYFY